MGKVDLNSRASLIKDYRNGNLELRNKIVEDCMDLAKQCAQKYFGLGVEEEDLIQTAYEATLIAIDELSVNKCKNYTRFIIKRIEQEIRRVVAQANNFFDKDEYHSNKIFNGQLVEILRIKRDFLLEFGREATLEEINERLGFHFCQIKEILDDYERRNNLSVEELTIQDIPWIVGNVLDVEFDTIRDCEREGLATMVRRAYLTPGELRLLKYFQMGVIDVSELANKLGTSEAYIYFLRKSAYRKLCKYRALLCDGVEDDTLKRKASEAEKVFTNKRKKERQRNKFKY